MILFFKSRVKPFSYVNANGSIVHVPGYERKDAARGQSNETRASFLIRYRAGESCPEIAASVGMSTSAVWKVIKDAGAIRSHSEAMALRMEKHPNLSEHRGVQLAFHSKKNDAWLPAGSRYEFIRMDQLENDPAVLRFDRSRDRIPYEVDGVKRHYIPDLVVTYMTGVVEVEEIKPRDMTLGAKVHAKTKAAMKFYRERGIGYRVVTEEDIGWDSIRKFDWPGVSGVINADLQEQRQEKERSRQREAKRKQLDAMSTEERAERNRLQRENYKAKQLTDSELAERRRKNAEAQRALRSRRGGELKKSASPILVLCKPSPGSLF